MAEYYVLVLSYFLFPSSSQEAVNLKYLHFCNTYQTGWFSNNDQIFTGVLQRLTFFMVILSLTR